MIVCHCNAVCDRTVRDAVRGGASSSARVRRACGAGGVCGGCRPVIEEILAEELHAPVVDLLPSLDLASAG